MDVMTTIPEAAAADAPPPQARKLVATDGRNVEEFDEGHAIRVDWQEANSGKYLLSDAT